MKEWQKDGWPRHVRLVPADNGTGYMFDPDYCGNVIIRAIVADGAVNSRPSWEQSPQVRAWMDDQKPGLLKRFKAWLDK